MRFRRAMVGGQEGVAFESVDCGGRDKVEEGGVGGRGEGRGVGVLQGWRSGVDWVREGTERCREAGEYDAAKILGGGQRGV
jgi:hypothetical protein